MCENLAEEMNSGVKGGILNILFPRTMEHATRDVLSGEQTEGYGKDTMLDATENGLQFAATPLTGPAGALMKYVRAAKALDKGSKGAKAVKGAGTLAGIAGDAAVVPPPWKPSTLSTTTTRKTRGANSRRRCHRRGINVVTPWHMKRRGYAETRARSAKDLTKGPAGRRRY